MTKELTREEIKQLIAEAVREVLSELLPASVPVSPSEYPRWLPSKEASRYSGLSEKTLRKLAQEGEIYAASVGGGKLLFDRYSIDDFLLKQQREVKLRVDAITKEALRLSR